LKEEDERRRWGIALKNMTLTSKFKYLINITIYIFNKEETKIIADFIKRIVIKVIKGE